MAKRRRPLTCKVCGKKFSYSAKTNPFGRMSKHMWKSHKPFMMKRQKAGKRKASKVTKLDREFMAIDDILVADLIDRKSTPLMKHLEYDPVHEQLGGLLLKAILPIAIEGIAKAIQKKRVKKK